MTRAAEPRFWYGDSAGDRLASGLLSPFSALWQTGAVMRRMAVTEKRVSVPVWCVGNLVAGGAGKTPVTLSLAQIARAIGLRPHVVLRGYGGRLKGSVPVDIRTHTAADVGDEALLYAARLPAWVSADRVAGARAAIQSGAGMIFLDDGFQNPALHKDFSLLVVDGSRGFGNGRILPAGPLRESLASGLGRAQAVVILGQDRAGVAEKILRLRKDMPVLTARLVLDEAAQQRLRGAEIVAFAGIGNPEKFRQTVLEAGGRIKMWKPFPDHFPYRTQDILPLLDVAAGSGALLVTTEKDAVRLPSDLRDRVFALPVSVQWDNRAMVEHFLAKTAAAVTP